MLMWIYAFTDRVSQFADRLRCDDIHRSLQLLDSGHEPGEDLLWPSTHRDNCEQVTFVSMWWSCPAASLSTWLGHSKWIWKYFMCFDVLVSHYIAESKKITLGYGLFCMLHSSGQCVDEGQEEARMCPQGIVVMLVKCLGLHHLKTALRSPQSWYKLMGHLPLSSQQLKWPLWHMSSLLWHLSSMLCCLLRHLSSLVWCLLWHLCSLWCQLRHLSRLEWCVLWHLCSLWCLLRRLSSLEWWLLWHLWSLWCLLRHLSSLECMLWHLCSLWCLLRHLCSKLCHMGLLTLQHLLALLIVVLLEHLSLLLSQRLLPAHLHVKMPCLIMRVTTACRQMWKNMCQSLLKRSQIHAPSAWRRSKWERRWQPCPVHMCVTMSACQSGGPHVRAASLCTTARWGVRGPGSRRWNMCPLSGSLWRPKVRLLWRPRSSRFLAEVICLLLWSKYHMSWGEVICAACFCGAVGCILRSSV